MSSQAEVAEKHAYIEQLLSEDKLMSPNKVVERVTKKFGTGISKAEVANIRMEKHGIKLGPGGYVFDKDGNRLKNEARPRQVRRGRKKANEAPSPAAPSASGAPDRLSKLLAELQAEMQLQQVQQLTVPATGPAEAIQQVKRVFSATSAAQA